MEDLSHEEPWGYWLFDEVIEKLAQKYNPFGVIRPPDRQKEVLWETQNMHLATNEQLGDMLSFFGAWTSYLLSEIGILEGELGVVKSVTEIGINVSIAALEKPYLLGAEKKRLTDSIRGDAISNDEGLRYGKRREIELQAKYDLTKRFFESYDKLWQGASREMTRRQMVLEKRS